VGISVVTRPTAEPITLDEALAQCRIDQDIENGLISGYIIAARQFAEKFLRCPILAQTFDYTIDFLWPWVRYQMPELTPIPFWRTRIELPLSSVTAVQSIQYVDVNGAIQTLDPSQYIKVLDGPIPYIEPAFATVWPIPRYQPACATVRFDAGLGKSISDLSRNCENVRMAILLLVSYWYDNRGSAQFGARARMSSDASGTVSSSIMPADIPPGVEALLSFERRVRMA
jgi:uncharacterized phiE125 gp8 family phage protein